MSTTSFPLTERFSQALVLAHRLHKGQYRKRTGVPYLAHLLAVASLVLEAGGSETEAMAALLHDAAEDQGGEPTLLEIEGQFGPRIAAIVRSCSDTLETPKPPWEPRKRAHLEKLRSCDASTLLVVAADKLHNARDTLESLRREGPEVWERFHASREQSLWFYRSVEEVLRATEDDRVSELCQRLTEVIDALERAVDDGEPAARPPATRGKASASEPSVGRTVLLRQLDAVLTRLARGNTGEARLVLTELRDRLPVLDLAADLRRRAESDTGVALEILDGSDPHLAARAASRLGTLREILEIGGDAAT